MTAMPETNKFLKYSIITILIMLVILIGLTIAMIVLTATEGGPPDDDSMCSMMPEMCATGAPPGGNTTSTPSETVKTTTTTTPSSVNPTTPSPDSHNPGYQINDSPGYTEIAIQFLTSINFSVDPCEDFYAFACGQWPSQHPTPSHLAAWTEYDLVSSHVSQVVRDSIEKVDLSDASEGLVKAKHFYNTCMNVSAIENVKGTLLGKWLHTGTPESIDLPVFENGTGRWALIDKDYVSDSSLSFEAQIGRLKSYFGIDSFWLPYAMQYSQNSAETILWLTPTMLPLGIGMFQQPYYIYPDYQYVMDAYSTLQQQVAQLLARDSGFKGVTLDPTDVSGMLNLEIELANLTYSYSFDIEVAHPKERPRPENLIDWNNDLWDLKTLQNKIPDFNWSDYLKNLVDDDLWKKLNDDGQALIWVDAPDYYSSLADILKNYRPRDIRNYIIWRLVKYSLPYMSSEYTAALATFNSILKGQNITATPQSEVCLSYLKGNYEMPNLAFATAEAVVKQNYFPVDEKNKAVEMVSQVKNGLSDLISTSTWMDDQTKNAALQKVKLMDAFVAYPDWVLNKTAQQLYYKDLKIPSASFISLNLMLRGWAVRKQLTEIGMSLGKREFPGTPLGTDAWYSAETNILTCPLGELQNPFFGLDYPDAVNFGGAGSVFGHEASHGLDKNGANYDAYGNESNWWTNSSRQSFNNHCNCLINQFNNYCYPDIGCVNGNQTINENIADLAGIKAAYKAYKKQPGPQYRLAKAPMFNDDQLFFLSFASFWCGSETKGAIQQNLQTDVHTPSRFRVIGTLRNVPEFAQAFQCSKISYMNPQERCSIW